MTTPDLRSRRPPPGWYPQGGAPDAIMIDVAGPDGKTFKAPLPDGYVPITTVERDYIPRTAADASRNQEAARIRATAKDELVKDDGFKEFALKTWGIDLEALAEGTAGGKGKGKVTEEELQRLRTEFEEKQLKPVQEQLETALTQVEYSHELFMQREVMDAANALGVDAEYLQPGPNGLPLIMGFFIDAVVYDTEDGAAYAADPKTGEPRISGKRRAAGESPYMTVKEAMEELVTARPKLLTQRRQPGSNFREPPKGGGGGGAVTEIDGSDIREVGKHLKEIAAGTVKVRVPGVNAA